MTPRLSSLVATCFPLAGIVLLVAHLGATSIQGDPETRRCDPVTPQDCPELATSTTNDALRLPYLRTGCAFGDTRSCFLLGDVYASGRYGTMKDDSTAFGYFVRACNRDYWDACRRLEDYEGLGLASHERIESSVVRAQAAYARRCESVTSLVDAEGADACTKASELAFASRTGVLRDPKGRNYLSVVCGLGDGVSCVRLAQRSISGNDGLPKDLDGARLLFERSCAPTARAANAQISNVCSIVEADLRKAAPTIDRPAESK